MRFLFLCRPLNQDSGMKDEKMIKSDEHLLEGKGGFIEQAWLAFQLFKAKVFKNVQMLMYSV